MRWYAIHLVRTIAEQMQPVPDRDRMAEQTPVDAGCTGCEETQSPSRGDESDGSAVVCGSTVLRVRPRKIAPGWAAAATNGQLRSSIAEGTHFLLAVQIKLTTQRYNSCSWASLPKPARLVNCCLTLYVPGARPLLAGSFHRISQFITHFRF